MRICEAEEGCTRKAHARGLCGMHYQRAVYSGQLPDLEGREGSMTADQIQRVSGLADAACPRFILILHPNFKLPEGFHLGAAAHDKHGRRPA